MHLCFMDSEKKQTPLTKRHCTQHSNHLTKDSGFVPILRNSSTVPTTIVENSIAIAPQISSSTPNSSIALQTPIKGMPTPNDPQPQLSQ